MTSPVTASEEYTESRTLDLFYVCDLELRASGIAFVTKIITFLLSVWYTIDLIQGCGHEF